MILHFCQSINDSNIAIEKSTVLTNMYERQKVKIQKALASLHEDIQADYMHELESL